MNVTLINHKKGEKPKLNLSVQRVESNVWKDLQFHKHHYLTEDLNKSCKCFLFYIEDTPIGFCAVLNTPRKGNPNGCAISRIVVFPDHQGLGLGSQICNFIGSIFSIDENHQLYIKTVNPSLGIYFTNHPDKWTPTSYNGKKRANVDKFEGGKYNNRVERLSYCFRYCGEYQSGYEDLLLPIAEMRNLKRKNIK